MAFLFEVQRFYTIVPLAGPRRALQEITIEDYTLPKNTTVLLAVGDVHFDPEIWSEPEKFKPERFLDSEGNLINTEHFYSFGIGEYSHSYLYYYKRPQLWKKCNALSTSTFFLTFSTTMHVL